MRSLEESVRRLERLAGKLNQATDKLNEQIEAFEKRLTLTRIGLEIWLADESEKIPADPLGEDQSLGYYSVGWAKLGDSWRLAAYKVEWRDAGYGSDSGWIAAEPQPLVNAPRHVRMRALPLVLSIVERLGSEAERWLKGIQAAIQSLSRIPTRCGLAREGREFDVEIRQLLFGNRRSAYRVLFTVRANEVRVLHVRHSARRTMEPGEIEW